MYRIINRDLNLVAEVALEVMFSADLQWFRSKLPKTCRLPLAFLCPENYWCMPLIHFWWHQKERLWKVRIKRKTRRRLSHLLVSVFHFLWNLYWEHPFQRRFGTMHRHSQPRALGGVSRVHSSVSTLVAQEVNIVLRLCEKGCLERNWYDLS